MLAILAEKSSHDCGAIAASAARYRLFLLAMPITPSNLSARIDVMFTLTDLPRAVEINQRLIVDTLELAAEQDYDVGLALQSMREGLRAGLERSGLA